MGRGLEYEVPHAEADTFTAVRREFVGFLVRYDFNRLAVYLSFRTPIGEKLPPPPPLWRRHWQVDCELLYPYTVHFTLRCLRAYAVSERVYRFTIHDNFFVHPQYNNP